MDSAPGVVLGVELENRVEISIRLFAQKLRTLEKPKMRTQMCTHHMRVLLCCTRVIWFIQLLHIQSSSKGGNRGAKRPGSTYHLRMAPGLRFSVLDFIGPDS